MMELILPNRDGFDIRLVKCEYDSEKFYMKLEEWMPVSVHGNSPIVAIDPPGGPMIGVGYAIETLEEYGKVSSIMVEEGKFVVMFNK